VLYLAKQIQLGPYLFWIGVCLVLLLAASIAVLWYRAKVLGRDQAADQGGLLHELRQMRDRGELSPEEYDAARHAMATRAVGKHVPAPKPSPATKAAATSELVAKPGFDLTGQPLPRPPQAPDV